MLNFLIISNLIFFLGFLGIFLIKSHIIMLFVCMELFIISINLNFVIFDFFLNDLLGQIFLLIVFNINASELAVGLSILILYYKLKGGISINFINLLKG